MEFSPETNQRIEAEVDALLATLNLKEKVALLSGKDHWGTVPNEAKGIPEIIVTDGPHGVRIGNENSDREKNGTATAFPTGVAMASTWDPALIHDVAIALAEETRANGCDVLLGPCVNIVRVPVAGRNFESYTEDPFLAGKIGAAYVKGLQSRGIGASLKHFACNNQEMERNRGSSNLDERTLREIYLPAFETIVKEAHPWTVMCSYNRINGEHASQNRHLLTEILKEEWDYDGVVVSDWWANHTIYESVAAGLDLEMPGPAAYYGNLLENAVRFWQIEEEAVDAAARRMLRLIKRVEAYKAEHPEDKGAFSNKAHTEIAKKASEASIVLLKNDNAVLPLPADKIDSLAVIGPCADIASYCGGGSSFVACAYNVSPKQGLKNIYEGKMKVGYTQGCSNRIGADSLAYNGFTMSYGGQPGFLQEFFDNREFAGEPASAEMIPEIDNWRLAPPDGVNRENYSVRWRSEIQVERSGEYALQTNYMGDFQFLVDGEVFLEDPHWLPNPQVRFFTVKRKTIQLEAGKTYHFEVKFATTSEGTRQSFTLQAEYLISPEEMTAQIEEAAALAKDSDYAIVFAGHAIGFESEGRDRTSITLPGEQDRLIAAVCAANPKTVVVLNTGAPIEMPWAKDAAAIVQAHFFGQEGGNALAAVLDGQVNPSGKLTSSYPLRYQDNPTYVNYPAKRQHNYGEGIFVGYRYYDFKDMEVLFPFGHGLSYTQFAYSDLKISGSLAEGSLKAHFTVKNVGAVDGAEAAQMYVADLACNELRPPKELKGFQKVFLKAGESCTVELPLNERAFSYFDNHKLNWVLEPGQFEIQVGASSRDIRLSTVIDID